MAALLDSVTGRFGATINDLRGDGRGWVLVAVATGWLFVLGTRVVLPALLPQIKVAFGLDNATAGLLVTLLWGAYALTQFPAGVLIDRIGERRTLVTSVVVAVVGILALTVAPTFLAFVAGLLLFGLGSGLYAPPRVTVLSRTFADNDGTALGVTFAIGNLGAAALPPIAAAIALWVGWRAGFGFVAPLLAIVGIALWTVVPRRSSTPGATGELSRRAASRVVRAVLARKVVLSWVALTMMLFAYQGLGAFLPIYLIEAKGLGQGVAAVLYSVFYASGAISQSFAGTAADVYGSPTVLSAIAGFGVLTLVALPAVDGVWALAPLVVLLGTRLGIGPVGNGYVTAMLPADVQGTGYGLFRAFYLAVGATGSLFVGVLAEAGLFDEAFLALAGVTAVSAGVFRLLPMASDVP
jgi:predicted MFS family arabinose efflux permease